jgi:N6-L-threonylcarbamoyladenine synthase
MLVLGIESSCDDTGAAVISDSETPEKRILSNIVYSQMDHKVHGGVVPEIAARAHLNKIETVIAAAMKQAGISFEQLDGVAATTGPGLIGGVMVGMMAAKAIALSHNKPFLGINHLEGHALTARLSDNIAFPYLLLLVSGGHTQILIARGVGDYEVLGTTLDDAAGECFDKSAKMMGLPFPGGPNLEKLANECPSPEKAAGRFALPTPMIGKKNCDFSFSGLKTAVRNHVEAIAAQQEENAPLPREDMAMLACAFQQAAQKMLINRLEFALNNLCPQELKLNGLVVAGGVAANKSIRAALENLTEAYDLRFIAPPLQLCTDNGAMIGWAGLERLKRGQSTPLSQAARPRWPLSELEALSEKS